MKKVFVIMISLLTIVAFAGSVMAQAPAKPAEPAKPAAPAEKPKADKPKAEKKEAPKAMKAAGVVAGYEAGKMIKVKGKDKEMTFDVTGDTKVKGEVKDGAKVTVMYKKDGDKMIATSIAAAAEKKPAEKKAAEKKPAEPAKPAAPAPAAPEKK
jgi:Cu/Ag efflux protein CusF